MISQGVEVSDDLLERANMIRDLGDSSIRVNEIDKGTEPKKLEKVNKVAVKPPPEPKQYQTTNEKKSLDYVLIETIKHNAKDQKDLIVAYDTLYKKFEHLILKMYGSYIRKMQKTPMYHRAHDLSEYKSHAFDVMLKAIASLNLDKITIEKRETWGFWIQFYNYLNTYNGFLIRQDKKISLVEVPYEIETDDEKTVSILNTQIDLASNHQYEHYTIKEKNQLLFWQAVELTMSKLSEQQKIIWIEREKGTPISKIRGLLGFNDFRYKKALVEIKEVFQQCVATIGGDEFLEENFVKI
jgi:hypothetical protein